MKIYLLQTLEVIFISNSLGFFWVYFDQCQIKKQFLILFQNTWSGVEIESKYFSKSTSLRW